MNPSIRSPSARSAGDPGFALPVFVLATAAFAVIAWQVVANDRLTVADRDVSAWLHGHASPGLTSVMLVVTMLNSTFAVAVYAGLLALHRAWRGQARRAIEWVVGVGGMLLVNDLLKHLFERARPHFEDPLLRLETFSFPSGHAAGSTAFYGLLALGVFHLTARWPPRLAALAGAAAMIALVAFSRVYLGVHFLSDVLAGSCAAIAWLALSLGVLGNAHRPSAGNDAAAIAPARPDR